MAANAFERVELHFGSGACDARARQVSAPDCHGWWQPPPAGLWRSPVAEALLQSVRLYASARVRQLLTQILCCSRTSNAGRAAAECKCLVMLFGSMSVRVFLRVVAVVRSRSGA